MNWREITLVIFFMIYVCSGFTQNPKTDSLTALINKEADPVQKAHLLIQRSKSYPQSDGEKPMKDAREALNLYRLSNDHKGQTDALLMISSAYSRMNNYQQALETSLEALGVAGKSSYKAGEAIAYSNIGRNQVQMGKFEEAEKSYTRALKLMVEAGVERDMAEIYNRMAILFFRSTKYYLALEYLDSALMFADKYDLDNIRANVYMNKGNNYTQLTRYDEALENYLKSIEIREKRNDEKGILQSYGNLGNVYKNIGQNDKAELIFRKSVQLASRLNIKTSLGLAYSNLAITLEDMKRMDSVEYFYEKALSTFAQTSEKPGISLVLHNFGSYLYRQGNYAKAETMLNRALILRKEMDIPADIANTLHMLGKIEIARNNNLKAEKLLKEALSMTDEESVRNKAEILQSLADFYKSNGNFEKALTYKEDLSAIKDSMITESELVKINRLQSEFDLSRKEAELTLSRKNQELQELAADQQRSRLKLLSLFLMVLTMAVAFLIVAFRSKRTHARQLQEKNSRIETLIQEVHHRVKNNLQIVSGLLAAQSGKMEENQAQIAIDEGRMRIQAIALLHEKLTRNFNTARINLSEYLNSLADLSAESLGLKRENIEMRLQMQNPWVDVDRAIPLGLIVNELITNSYKHASRNEPDGLKIYLILDEEDEQKARLIFSDNGNEFGLKGKNIMSINGSGNGKGGKSVGMSLFNSLVKQIGGELIWSNQPGITCMIRYLKDR